MDLLIHKAVATENKGCTLWVLKGQIAILPADWPMLPADKGLCVGRGMQAERLHTQTQQCSRLHSLSKVPQPSSITWFCWSQPSVLCSGRWGGQAQAQKLLCTPIPCSAQTWIVLDTEQGLLQ